MCAKWRSCVIPCMLYKWKIWLILNHSNSTPIFNTLIILVFFVFLLCYYLIAFEIDIIFETLVVTKGMGDYKFDAYSWVLHILCSSWFGVRYSIALPSPCTWSNLVAPIPSSYGLIQCLKYLFRIGSLLLSKKEGQGMWHCRWKTMMPSQAKWEEWLKP